RGLPRLARAKARGIGTAPVHPGPVRGDEGRRARHDPHLRQRGARRPCRRQGLTAMLQAVIFDCDGVLVDTERDGHRVAFNACFRELGWPVEWSVERYGQLLATAGGKERMRRHFDETGWPVAPAVRDAAIAQAHKVKTGHFMKLIESGGLPLRPGIARLVGQTIDAGLTLAVCSTSNERAVQMVVDRMLGAQSASHIRVFAGDVVPRKKPDPAIYRLAAQTLGLDPARCVVIE